MNCLKSSIISIFFILSIIAGGFLPVPFSSGTALAQNSSQPTPPSFAGLVKKTGGAVVNISSVMVVSSKGEVPFSSPFGQDDPLSDFFERFFGNAPPREFKQRSLGSGFIIDASGLILTNSHVVQKAEKIEVSLSDGRRFNAEIVGHDQMTDLALIRIQTGENLPQLPLGDSESLEVGDWVVAIGSPFGLGNTVTAGIVSAKYRKIGTSAYDDFIQTDASINPGNSGGPLLNLEGEVIGVNTAIFSRSGGNIGIGFAVPINMVKELLPQLKRGKVIRGWLGVLVQELSPELREKLGLEDEQGALVSDVTKESPAEQAGIQRGDLITSFDGTPVTEMSDLPGVVAMTPVGKEVVVEVLRKGRTRQFKVKVGELPIPQEETEASGEMPSTPQLGLGLKEVTPEFSQRFGLPVATGLVVVQVVPDSPAAEAGMMPGDVILEVEQEAVEKVDDFIALTKDLQPGDSVLMLVYRGGNTLYLTLEVQ